MRLNGEVERLEDSLVQGGVQLASGAMSAVKAVVVTRQRLAGGMADRSPANHECYRMPGKASLYATFERRVGVFEISRR